MWSVRRALALSWALGTSTGVLLGLSGVQLVTSGITGARIAPLSRPEVLQALSAASAKEASEAAAAAASPASTPDIGSAPPLPDPVSKPAPKPPASAPPRPGATAGTTTTTVRPPPPPAPPATAPPAPPAVAAPPEPQPTTTTEAPRGETRAISSRGGTVTVRYLDGEVSLRFARPNSGYDVEVVDDGPDRVYVVFQGHGERSRVFAFYNKKGEPDATVIEKGGGKDDGGVNSTGSRVSQESGGSDLERWREYWERSRR
jgi:hypothetical protein